MENQNQNQNQNEFEIVSKATVITSAMAAQNIEKFTGLKGLAVHQRMRIYDEMVNQTSNMVDESVKLAEQHLKAYLDLKKSNSSE